MKVMFIFLLFSNATFSMRYPIPLYPNRLESQLPIEYLNRPGTPRPSLYRDRAATPPIRPSTPDFQGPFSPNAVRMEEVRAHAQEAKALSKKQIACIAGAAAIVSAALTATVTLTIHFTECNK